MRNTKKQVLLPGEDRTRLLQSYSSSPRGALAARFRTSATEDAGNNLEWNSANPALKLNQADCICAVVWITEFFHIEHIQGERQGTNCARKQTDFFTSSAHICPLCCLVPEPAQRERDAWRHHCNGHGPERVSPNSMFSQTEQDQHFVQDVSQI